MPFGVNFGVRYGFAVVCPFVCLRLFVDLLCIGVLILLVVVYAVFLCFLGG